MNPNTGHLISLLPGADMPVDYEKLPAELLATARRKLERAERIEAMSSGFVAEAHVNLRSSTPLAQWAKKKRLAKIAAKSRRRNRK